MILGISVEEPLQYHQAVVVAGKGYCRLAYFRFSSAMLHSTNRQVG